MRLPSSPPPPRSGARRLLAPLMLAAAPPALAAQARDVDRYDVRAAEGRLLAFYSAALAFSPAGAPVSGTRAGAIGVGVELSYVPRLSAAQRSAGYDKPEATNLAPLLPRPRATLTLPRGAGLEVGWLPPVRVFGVRAQLLSVAVTTPSLAAGPLLLAGRGSFTTGRVRGPITCNASLAEQPSRDLKLYFASICYGNESDDHYIPRQLGGELLMSRRGTGWRGVSPYGGAGLRAQRIRFDIGVIKRDGTRDPDQPILELRGVRGYGFAGVSRSVGGRARLGGELFYEPGSLLTARVSAELQVRRAAAARVQ